MYQYSPIKFLRSCQYHKHVYDALLATDMEKYKEWVLNEIRREYGKMIELGSTVWETIDGASAFDNAGSLCHGWSAIPIYYYAKWKCI